MCGIAGIFGRSDPDAVVSMLRALRHRGPDDEGIFSDDAVTLGHRRLSIIDTSPAGHQPMTAADGDIQIVYNGEIYNYRERRQALSALGRKFRSESDTEVILALYERYGDSFVSLLRGIFALAIYDRRGGAGRERLLLARDPFGIKPLLYANKGGRLVFCSELKGVLASGLVSRDVDSESLRLLLSLGSVFQPRTMLRDVKALPSGHYMVVDQNGSQLQRYWRYQTDRIAGLRNQPYRWQVEALREILTNSVRCQMIADVPVGAFLSGGVDSSLIVALMARETNQKVKTFSVGFEDQANAIDESGDAAETAKYIGTDHNRIVVGSNEIADHFGRFVTGLDQPSVDGFNSYFVSYAAAQQVTVALSGTGGDEIFLGYPWFASMERQFGAGPLQTGAGNGASPGNAGIGFRHAFGCTYNLFGPEAAHALMAPDRRTEAPPRSFADDLLPNDELRDAGALERASVLCLNGYTRNQLLRDIDACSMAHSLEVRVPFLDPVVADFALSLPAEAKLRANERSLEPNASYDVSGVKRIVCDVARNYLPSDFFSKRSKTGFTLPFADWLRGTLSEMLADTLSPAAVRAAGLFDPDAVGEVYQGFLRGDRYWSHPWTLMVTELWRRDVLAT